MGKLSSRAATVLIVLLIIAAIWYVVQKNQHGNVEKSDTFVCDEQDGLYWFEITGQHSNIKGTFHQRKIMSEPGKVPFMEEKDYPLTGKTTEKGYTFRIEDENEEKKFDASFSKSNLLLVQESSNMDGKTCHAAKGGEIKKYVKDLRQELQTRVDQSEEKEKQRLHTFFSKLNHTYGFLYTAKNGEYQLFLKIDETLHQGELEGSLVVTSDPGKANKPYKEDRYVLHGITDGQMVEFYTTADGEGTKMEGHFHKDASGLELSFWKNDQQVTFDAVTEKEFEKKRKDFKKKNIAVESKKRK